MRPREEIVTFVLNQLVCNTAQEGGGDEPYLWILGFKVDADTIGPPSTTIAPTLGVQVFEGAPASPFPIGSNSIYSHQTAPIPPALGTRSFRLRPALLLTGDWFPGIAGMICLLWDQDAFSPSTSEAGFNKFKHVFGPALSTELNALVSDGKYDDPLSRDASNNVVSTSDGTLLWRLSRLQNPAARTNAVKAITGAVKDNITGQIKDTLKDAAGWDELIDPDDLLGAQAQVYTGDELTTLRSFSLSFTDDDANYDVKGQVSSHLTDLAQLDSYVTQVAYTLDREVPITARVCWFPPKVYMAQAITVRATTRFELRTIIGRPPASVRWFLNGVPIADGQGTMTVHFEAADAFYGPPQDQLAAYYTGGLGVLKTQVAGPILDISNESTAGVFFGEVAAVYAYDGDPSIVPPPPRTFNELVVRAYDQRADLSVIGVELTMDAEYRKDIAECKRIEDEINRKHIAVNYGKMRINPGDPPPDRQQFLDRVSLDARVANAAGLEIVVRPLGGKTIVG